MHRHGYQGRKFHRERDQRKALIKGLADSLVRYGAIETTLPKAKELAPYIERLITKAKKGSLHDRRQIIAALHTAESAHKLVDELAPQMKGRNSGHVRIERTSLRRGDNTQLARISFVDELKKPEAGPQEATATPEKPKPAPAKAKDEESK